MGGCGSYAACGRRLGFPLLVTGTGEAAGVCAPAGDGVALSGAGGVGSAGFLGAAGTRATSMRTSGFGGIKKARRSKAHAHTRQWIARLTRKTTHSRL